MGGEAGQRGMIGRFEGWRVCVVVSRRLCARGDWERVVRSAARGAEGMGGADCFQLREKGLDGGELLDLAREFVGVCRACGVAAVINDRVDVALLAGADGVHLGQTDMRVGDARALGGEGLIVGVSTTNLEQARRAVAEGADYCGVGPVFATATKPERAAAGLGYVRKFRGAHPEVPHLAIGGIDTQNIPSVIAAGAQGVAVSRAVCGAEDPGEAAGLLAGQINRAVGVTAGIPTDEALGRSSRV